VRALGSQLKPALGGATKEAATYIHNGEEINRYERTSLRHGARISRYHGCLGCVVDEARRHKARTDASHERKEPIPVESVCQAAPTSAEMH
jgi:hypothetical protein